MTTTHSNNQPLPQNTTPSRNHLGEPVTTIDRLTVAYLALPNLIFLGGWLKPIWGIPAVVLLSMAVVSLLWQRSQASLGFSKTKIAVCLTLAAAWLFLSGIGHYSYANDDWIVRDAVYADLINQPWPVEYALPQQNTPRLLRAPLAYYLPAALVSSFAGIDYADLALFTWSLAGVALVMYLIVCRSVTIREMLCRLLIFILFSGMDLIGNLLIHITPELGQHLERWGGRFQFSSNTTALFWVPNHAIGCWLALFWLLNQRRGRVNLPLAVLIAGCTPLWSPLSALGLIPFFATATFLPTPTDQRSASERIRSLNNWQAILTTLILVIFIYPYLLLHGGTIYSGWALKDLPVITAIQLYMAFVVLEFAALTALLLYRYPRDIDLWIAGGLLFFIPLYSFGPNSDFSMRVSLPALAFLAFKLGDWAVDYSASQPSKSPKPSRRRLQNAAFTAAMVIFFVGAVTPISEGARAFKKPRWDFTPNKSMLSVGAGAEAHYTCPRQGRWVEIFLR